MVRKSSSSKSGRGKRGKRGSGLTRSGDADIAGARKGPPAIAADRASPARVLCKGPLAVPVDLFSYEATYVPLQVQVRPGRALPNRGTGISLEEAVSRERRRAAEEEARQLVKNLKLSGLNAVAAKTRQFGLDESALRERITSDVQRSAASMATRRAAAKDPALWENGSRLAALERVSALATDHFNLFRRGRARRGAARRRPRQGLQLISLPYLGFVFLERLRLRPLGYTIERAPFNEVCLEPGGTATVKQRSFTKHSISFEEHAETEQERKLEYSSAFSTELTHEYEKEVRKESGGGFSLGAVVPIKGIAVNIGGNYDASSVEQTSRRAAAKRSYEASRRVESRQKTLHKTMLNFSREETFESEGVKTLVNATARTQKFLFRRVMQVLHASLERYDARMCWTICVDDLKAAVWPFVPATLRVAYEEIRAEGEAAEPPKELARASTSPDKIVVTDSLDLRYSDGWWKHEIGLDSDVIYWDATLEVSSGFRFWLFQRPTRGQTGQLKFTAIVHRDAQGVWSGQSDEWIAELTLRVTTARNSKVSEWRERRIFENWKKYLETNPSGWRGLHRPEWFRSVLEQIVLRRISLEAAETADCSLIAELRHAFEWEKLNYQMFRSLQTASGGAIPPMPLEGDVARIFLPFRPGHEERCIGILLALEVIPPLADLAAEIEQSLIEFRSVYNSFNRSRKIGDVAVQEIAGPDAIDLTPLGSARWNDADLETDADFVALSRYLVTIPTDGVDVEEASLVCVEAAPLRQSREKQAEAEAKLVDALADKVQAGDQKPEVRVSWAPRGGE